MFLIRRVAVLNCGLKFKRTTKVEDLKDWHGGRNDGMGIPAVSVVALEGS